MSDGGSDASALLGFLGRAEEEATAAVVVFCVVGSQPLTT